MQPLTYAAFRGYLQSHDKVSFYGLSALLKMHGAAVEPYARDILKFIEHRNLSDPFGLYCARGERLRALQSEFEKTGCYPAASSNQVENIDGEQYKLALLLSFIATSHRFDILKSLVEFFRMGADGPREALAIGYGTGYELKLLFDEMPDWKALAFDSAPDSRDYATDLLSFFGHRADGLRLELFPLFNPGIEYRGRFGKVVLCEILEHLDEPEKALQGIRTVLHPGGLLFCTMAVNIAQEDHVYLYSSAAQARSQVIECGFEIVREMVAPAGILPFPDDKRAQFFKKGNYICVARPNG